MRGTGEGVSKVDGPQAKGPQTCPFCWAPCPDDGAGRPTPHLCCLDAAIAEDTRVNARFWRRWWRLVSIMLEFTVIYFRRAWFVKVACIPVGFRHGQQSPGCVTTDWRFLDVYTDEKGCLVKYFCKVCLRPVE